MRVTGGSAGGIKALLAAAGARAAAAEQHEIKDIYEEQLANFKEWWVDFRRRRRGGLEE